MKSVRLETVFMVRRESKLTADAVTSGQSMVFGAEVKDLANIYSDPLM